MTTYANLEILMDGAIRLYQDADLKGDVWQCRLRVPGVPKPYIRSTKTSNFEQAKAFATKLFYRLCYEVEHGIPIGEKTFRDLHKDFMRDKEHLLSAHRKKLHKGTADRYFIPFFGNKAVKSIDDGVLDEYWLWRIQFWATGPGAGLKVANAAIVPAQKSLDMERSMLNQIFRYAKTNKFIAGVPLNERPSLDGECKAAEITRRPSITPGDMKKLIDHMDVWANEGPTKRHRRQKQATQAAIFFYYRSGLRPNELYQVRWRDVRKVDADSDDVKEGYTAGGWIVEVAAKTKTGSRHAAAQPELQQALEIAAIAQGLEEIPWGSDGLIFPNEDGGRKKWWAKTIADLFKNADILYDNQGLKRTAYSLRHTYITERLLAGVDVYLLSRASGTSLQYIKKHYDHTSTEMHIGELTKVKGRKINNDGFAPAKAHPGIDDPVYAPDLD